MTTIPTLTSPASGCCNRPHLPVGGAKTGCVSTLHAVRNCASPAIWAFDRWRAVVHGKEVRRSLRVTTLAPGMVSVSLNASDRLLHRLGMRAPCALAEKHEHRPAATRQLTWLSLDPARCSGTVMQADSLVDPCRDAACDGHAVKAAGVSATARINGGFFNFRQRAAEDRGEHVPIGPVRTTGGIPQPCLPLPPDYVDDYRELQFQDGSSLVCAPLLGEAGNPVFAVKAHDNPHYRLPPGFDFERGDLVRPGLLWHAHDANPRAAISVPSTVGNGRIRLVVAPMHDRACAESGWTLAGFSTAMARLDRLHSPANASLNLDGGESIALLARDGERVLLDVRQTKVPRRVGNLIEFSTHSVPRSPEVAECVRLVP